MSARDFALAQIDSLSLPGWPERCIRRDVPAPVDSRDVALAEQIRVGCVKNVLWLQHLASYHSNRELSSIDPLVQKVLAVAIYQLRFLDRVPAHAALDEAVEQARRFGRGSAAGFVNAVLRNATRESDPPDDEVDPSIRWSHPAPLLRKLEKLLDDPAETIEFCRRNNEEPPTVLQLADGVKLADLSAEGVTLTPHAFSPQAAVATGARLAQLADWARRGLAHVQDVTSAAVVPQMEVEAGMTVLDRCAGVGTKTLQLSRRVGAGGRVFAVDPSHPRCELLRRTLLERGIDNVGVVESAWLSECRPILPARFDRVLIDAPCSNSGVLPRRPEARWRQDKPHMKSLLELQRKILFDTFDAVAPGGILVYSTCSIWPEENEILLERCFETRRDFTILKSVTTLPAGAGPDYRDGGFVAVMRRFAARRPSTSPPAVRPV